MNKDCCDSWMNGLKQAGLYYEGVVADLESLLESHKRETVTTWGTRRSSTNEGDLSDGVNTVIHTKTLYCIQLSPRPISYSLNTKAKQQMNN